MMNSSSIIPVAVAVTTAGVMPTAQPDVPHSPMMTMTSSISATVNESKFDKEPMDNCRSATSVVLSSSKETSPTVWSNVGQYVSMHHQTLYEWIEPSRQIVSSWLTGILGRSWNSALQYVSKGTSANALDRSANEYVDGVCAYCGDAICVKKSEQQSCRVVVCGAHCLQNWVAYSGFLHNNKNIHDTMHEMDDSYSTDVGRSNTPLSERGAQ